MSNNIIGIFYIATGIYKEYFPKFLETIKYLFPNKIKKLIVISDGLTEYNNMFINDVNIIVEDYIAYPYPFININKLQITYHYAQKHKINTIVYFDSETYFFEKSEEFYEELLRKSEKYFVSLIPPNFIHQTFRDHIYGMNNYTLFGQTRGFEDFDFFLIDENYKWIQTSFYICSINILKNIAKIVKNFITYNNRIMGCKLNYSDEFYINYLNVYYPELFFCDYYVQSLNNDVFKNSMFCVQKYKVLHEKNTYKFGNLNYNFRMFLLNINSSDNINKFFISHMTNFLLAQCNCNVINEKLFFENIILDDTWFTNENNNIILERSFYTDNFISLYNSFNVTGNDLYVGFISKINKFSNNFDYDKFYYESYDYIEGLSFNDIKNMKFKDIEMCCFSKKYIEAYFNNDLTFKPKIYKLNEEDS